jgi:hypothetical protein
MTIRWFCGVAFLALAACGSDISLEGADGAFISGNLVLGEDCTTTPDAPLLQSGEYDIAEAGESNGDPESHPCGTPYVMRLATEIDADQVALFDRATVTLRTTNGERLEFPDDLPSPFEITTAGSVRPKGETPKRGVVEVDAIPAAYAAFLDAFVDDGILVEVQLKGHLEDGSAVRTQAFSYPVHICQGCLTYCRDADILLGMAGVLPSDLTAGECSDVRSSGMDGRVCIDPDC